MGGSSSSRDEVIDEEAEEEKKADKAVPIRIEANQLRAFVADNKIPGQDLDALDLLQNRLCLNPSVINKFYSLFYIADKDQSGQIEFQEFFDFLVITSTPFNRRLFGLFDFDGSGSIDFIEFVCALFNLCTWRRADLPRLMFTLYAPDFGSTIQWLDLKVAKRLIKDLFHARQNKTALNLLLDSIEGVAVDGILEGEERVYLPEFKTWCKDHPPSTQIIETMQRFLRNRILGWNWWVTVGAETRQTILDEMEVRNRELLGESGAEEAMHEAIHLAAEKRRRRAKQREKMQQRRELARQQNGRTPGEVYLGDNEEEGEEEDDMLLPVPVIQAHDRVKAYRVMCAQRLVKRKKWKMIHKQLMADRDPFSVMVQCQAPWMLPALRSELEGEWAMAEEQMRKETYILPQMAGIENHEVYFQRKSALDVPMALQENGPVFSVAHGQRSWELEQEALRKTNRPRDWETHGEVNKRKELTRDSQAPPRSAADARATSRTTSTVNTRAMQADPAWFGMGPVVTQDHMRNETPLSLLLGLSPRPGSYGRLGSRGMEVSEELEESLTIDPRGHTIGYNGKYPEQNHKKLPDSYVRNMKRRQLVASLNMAADAKVNVVLSTNEEDAE